MHGSYKVLLQSLQSRETREAQQGQSKDKGKPRADQGGQRESNRRGAVLGTTTGRAGQGYTQSSISCVEWTQSQASPERRSWNCGHCAGSNVVIPEGPMCSQGKGYQTLVAGVQLDNDSGQLQGWDSRSALGSLRPRAVVGGQGDSHSVTPRSSQVSLPE